MAIAPGDGRAFDQLFSWKFGRKTPTRTLLAYLLDQIAVHIKIKTRFNNGNRVEAQPYNQGDQHGKREPRQSR